jgi:GNAT superfamily N-acetyltransferase
MIELQFLKNHLNESHQRIVNTGFKSHSKEVSAPPFQKDRINWLAYENSERIVGVLTADVLWDWIYIDELWVNKDYRGKGLGKQLVNKAEEYAISQNMTGLWLWTQSWQAPEFYIQLGYKEFTRFDDFPKGNYRIGFRKQVSRAEK